MPQDAPLVVGWAQDVFVLPAVLSAVLAGLPGTLLGRHRSRPHADNTVCGKPFITYTALGGLNKC
jgi:uncharacterized membrane protein YkvA (DUF1232 family)